MPVNISNLYCSRGKHSEFSEKFAPGANCQNVIALVQFVEASWHPLPFGGQKSSLGGVKIDPRRVPGGSWRPPVASQAQVGSFLGVPRTFWQSPGCLLGSPIRCLDSLGISLEYFSAMVCVLWRLLVYPHNFSDVPV